MFGHLAGIGCDKSDAAKFAALLTELGSDAGKLKGLDDLLKKGGFGTLDGADTATGTDARCLANLFLPGCEGKPGELTKLLTSLGSMMRYAFAPKNPPGGAQDGKKLKQLHSAFNGHMGDLVTTMEAT